MFTIASRKQLKEAWIHTDIYNRCTGSERLSSEYSLSYRELSWSRRISSEQISPGFCSYEGWTYASVSLVIRSNRACKVVVFFLKQNKVNSGMLKKRQALFSRKALLLVINNTVKLFLLLSNLRLNLTLYNKIEIMLQNCLQSIIHSSITTT